MPTTGNGSAKSDIKARMMMHALTTRNIKCFFQVEKGSNGIIIADSETVRWLEQYCIVSLTQQQRDRIEFDCMTIICAIFLISMQYKDMVLSHQYQYY